MYNSNTYFDKTITVNGQLVFLSAEVQQELHRQEQIQWGKDIVANYEGMYAQPTADITDDVYQQIAIQIEDSMMSDNGSIEYKVIIEVLGETEE